MAKSIILDASGRPFVKKSSFDEMERQFSGSGAYGDTSYIRENTPQIGHAITREVSINPIAFLCINKIASMVGQISFQVSDGEEFFPDHEVSQLIQNPSSNHNGWSFTNLIAMSLATTGQAFIRLSSGVSFKSLDFIPAQEIDIVENGVRIEKYVYSPMSASGDATQIDLNPEEVLHIKHDWLVDRFRGFSMAVPLWQSLNLYRSCNDHDIEIQNKGMVSQGIMTFSDLTDAQMKQIMEATENYTKNKSRYGKLALFNLGSRGKAQLHEIPSAKVDNEKQRESAIFEICNVYGIPPVLINFGNTVKYENQREANKTFLLQTLIPKYVIPIATALSDFLGERIEPNYERVEAMQDIKQDNKQQDVDYKKTISSLDYLTIDEKRKLAGFDPLPDGLGSVVVVTNSAKPLDVINDSIEPDEKYLGLDMEDIPEFEDMETKDHECCQHEK